MNISDPIKFNQSRLLHRHIGIACISAHHTPILTRATAATDNTTHDGSRFFNRRRWFPTRRNPHRRSPGKSRFVSTFFSFVWFATAFELRFLFSLPASLLVRATVLTRTMSNVHYVVMLLLFVGSFGSLQRCNALNELTKFLKIIPLKNQR